MIGSSELQNNIQKILREKEELVWQGGPNVNKRFTKVDLFIIPISVIWCCFIIFWEVIAASKSPVVMLLGLPFIAFGIYLSFGRFSSKRSYKEHTYYFVTNQRIMIYNNYKKEKFTEIGLRNISNLAIDIDKNGVGTITFNEGNILPKISLNQMLSNTGILFGNTIDNAFFDISDVREVYDLISSLLIK